MNNPILGALNARQMMPQNLGQIKQAINFIRSASNPQAAMQNMANSNPQMKQVMDFVQKSGGDPRKAFYSLAKEKGVDPDEILNMLK